MAWRVPNRKCRCLTIGIKEFGIVFVKMRDSQIPIMQGSMIKDRRFGGSGAGRCTSAFHVLSPECGCKAASIRLPVLGTVRGKGDDARGWQRRERRSAWMRVVLGWQRERG